MRQRALVLLPSLSLLAQTVREWCANARAAFDFLAVCSDESVIDEDLIVRTATWACRSRHDAATEIAAFLSAEGGRRVIFSTYQSSPRIAEALAVAGKSPSTSSSPTRPIAARAGSTAASPRSSKDEQHPLAAGGSS